jgi:rubrerythrin
MSLLKTEPPAPVRSLDELFAIAGALETEAAARYAELAGRMEAQGLPRVAEVFRRLEAEERGHAGQVEGWARTATGAPPDPALIRWRPPETFDEEEARGLASSRLASAYRALSMAVRNEERAFALWTYIAAQAEDPAIREAAERMAGEELRHAALLRRERRRAFHAERGRGREDGEPSAAAAPRRPPPAQEAAAIERALAALLADLGGEARAPSAQHVPELRRLAAEAAAMAEEALAVAEAGARTPPAEGTAQPRHGDRSLSPPGDEAPRDLSGALRLAERAVEGYLDAAEAAREEEAMRRVQSLAERGIARIALLRRIAGLA